MAAIWPELVIEEALDEYDELVSLDSGVRSEATALLDPSMSEAEKQKVTHARKAARKKISRGVVQRLKSWKDQVSGEFRLRFVEGVNANSKRRTQISAEPISKF